MAGTLSGLHKYSVISERADMNEISITDTRIPIGRRWWEIILRRPKYDHMRTYRAAGVMTAVYVNGMRLDAVELPTGR